MADESITLNINVELPATLRSMLAAIKEHWVDPRA